MAKYDVFISYSRKDYMDENKQIIPGNIVSQIKALFDENSISYWFDEECIYSGDAFARVIAKNIRASKILLFVSTESSNESPWTSDEIATARAYEKKIIPFRYDRSQYNESVILFVAKLDYIDYQTNPSSALNRLLAAVKDYLKTESERAAHEAAEAERRKQEEIERQLRAVKERELREKVAQLENRRHEIIDEILVHEKILAGLTREKDFVDKDIADLRRSLSERADEVKSVSRSKKGIASSNNHLLKNAKAIWSFVWKWIKIGFWFVVILLLTLIISGSILKACENEKPTPAPTPAQQTTQVSSNESARRAKEVAEFKALNIEMVYVSGGTFTMGGTSKQGSDAFDREKPTHSVTLSDFYIGKYEVTQAQWRAVMGSNPSNFTGDNNPVEQVSWNDIQEFITKLNAQTGKKFRLPTEAEWEYAARGGNKSKGYKYSGSNTIGNVAWYDGNSSDKTHPVGTKQPNELGIYDMSGNVWEWCQDWFGDYSSSSQTNPTGPSGGSLRVLRGGSWDSSARICRVSYRRGISPDFSFNYYGFRLACSPE